MDSLRLINYRCFSDTGKINIKPLTILLGANSSGKSSFLKFLPLLKQSIGLRVNGQFLWSSDNIDFNNFNNTLKDGTDYMEVCMTINDLHLSRRYSYYNQTFDIIEVSLTLNAIDENFEFLSKLCIKFDQTNIEVIFKDQYSVASIRVNNYILEGDNKIKCSITNSLLPKIRFFNNAGKYFDEESEAIEKTFYKLSGLKPGDSTSRRALTASFRKLGSRKSLMTYVSDECNCSNLELSVIERICDVITMYNINGIIDSLNLYFLSLASKISYVQPIRVFTQRFYRFQNYAIQDIDPDGRNLAMFYNSLSSEAFSNLNAWLNDVFGFTISLNINSGNFEILIKEAGKDKRNMVDVGFGYTQCLPILTLIWKVAVLDCLNGPISEEDRFCQEHIIAIEQPELHLHPRFQSLFVEMIAKAINVCHKNNKDIRFVIETHSESLINKLGELVASNIISTKDVNVLIFNAQHEGLANYVEQTHFTEEGFITNWPYGFFSYVDRSK